MSSKATGLGWSSGVGGITRADDGRIRSASGELAIQRSLRVRKRGRARAVRFVRSSLSARRLRGPSRTTGTKKGTTAARVLMVIVRAPIAGQ